MIEFTVLGEPKAQGSKRAFALRKGGVLTGKVALTESAGDGLKLWRSRLVEAVSQHAPPEGPWSEAVSVDIEFRLPEPKKPKHELPIGRVGDIDKLARAVLDTLTGVVIVDDSQVVRLCATKVYGIPGADIAVGKIDWPFPSSLTQEDG
jgi:Holliday junction resolvase RusA-like endonuclease